MSDLVFDLQRFAEVVWNSDEGPVTVQPYTAAGESGVYYFAENNDVTSTFTGIVTIEASDEEDDNGAIYLSVEGISLPSDAGEGTITTGTQIGSSADDAIAIANLGNATLTFGTNNPIAFTNAGSDAVLNVYGGNNIANIEGLTGSFNIAAENGGQIYVEGTDAENLVNINKPFTYVGGDEPAITVNEDGANVGAFDGVTQINAPSGADKAITISGIALEYSTTAQASIGVDSDSTVTSFTLNEVGDKIVVPAGLAKSEEFSIIDVDELNGVFPTVSGYTVEKTESGDYANGFATGAMTLDETYKFTNASGSAGILITDGELAGMVLGTNDSIAPAESDGDLSALGTEVSIYGGSLSSVIPVNLEGVTSPKITVVKTEDALTIDGLQAGDYEDSVVFDETVTVTAGTDDATSAGGAAYISDDKQVGFSITKGSFQLAGAGETPVVINDVVTIQGANSDADTGLIISGTEAVTVGVDEGATITSLLGAANTISDTVGGITVNVAGKNYTSGDGTNNTITLDAEGNVTATDGFEVSDDTADDTADDTTDDTADDTTDDTADDTTDDTADDTADDTEDDTADDTEDDTADDTEDDTADDTEDDTADDTEDDTADDTEDDTTDDTADDTTDEEITQPELASKSIAEIETLLETEAQPVSDKTYKVGNDDGNNLVYVPASLKGATAITLGKGGDFAYIDTNRSQGTNITVTGGAGDDSLLVRDTAPVSFDMSKGGADKVYLASDNARINVSLKGYNASNGGGIVLGGSSSAIFNAIEEGSAITFGDGELVINGTYKANVTFANNTSSSGQTVVNLIGSDGEAQKVGFTHSDGGSINVSSSGDAHILLGNYSDKKNGNSTLTGGKGDDTILAGAGDVVNAGAGKNNQIILKDDSVRGGAEVVVNAGTTTIDNANSGFDDSGDVINVDLSSVNLSSADGNLVVSGTGVHATVTGVATDGIVKQLIKNGSTTYKAAIAASGTEITVTDTDDIANYYQGDVVNFTEYEGSVKADLSGTTDSSIDGGAAVFKNAKTLYAGSGLTEFRGGTGNDTLYAGTGTTSLYGAGGRNILANASEGVEKDGATSFYVLSVADGARNTISNFEFLQTGENDNAGTADKIEIATQDGNIVSNAFIRGNGVVIEVSRGGKSESAFIENAVGKDMKFGDNVVAQVNTTSLEYDGAANFFIATEKNAAITVDESVSGAASIWLGRENFVGDIRTIDATASSVKAELAGNDADNIISAGSGDTSLWGGNGGDDILMGGTGKNSFFYTNGNGSDTIGGVNEGDLVYLSEITLDQIASTSVENNVATINFKDGGKLTINDASNASYILTQGDQAQIYKVNESGFVNA